MKIIKMEINSIEINYLITPTIDYLMTTKDYRKLKVYCFSEALHGLKP